MAKYYSYGYHSPYSSYSYYSPYKSFGYGGAKGHSRFSIKSSMYKMSNMENPISVDLNGDGSTGVTGPVYSCFQHSMKGKVVRFDINGDGKADTVKWYTSGDGILVDNRDGKAATDMSGKRFISDKGGKQAPGYLKASDFDTNADGMLTGDELKGLDLWVDNGDAVVQATEIHTLAQHNITSVSTASKWSKLPTLSDLLGDKSSLDTLLGSATDATSTSTTSNPVTYSDVAELLRKVLAAYAAGGTAHA